MRKVAIVCGSTQGIGKACAFQLAASGHSVVLVGRNRARLETVKMELESHHGPQPDFIVVDFTDPQALKQIIENWVSSGNHAHVLINNTGGPKSGPILSADTNEFIMAFNQHLICNHIMVQALVPGMIEAKFGRIVNIISTSVKQPLPNLGVSNTIRGAVANWSKTLAGELAPHGITVNNVLPGATNTSRLSEIASVKAHKTGQSLEDVLKEMGHESPANRIAEPEEVAAAVDFLASEKAAYINGINLPVDGGRTKSL